MTDKELLYIEDALEHERFFMAQCADVANKMQDGELKKCVEQMGEKHRMIFGNLYGLLNG